MTNMSIKSIDAHIIRRISKGEEKAFSLLYDNYYTYLNTVALCYIFDKDVANEIVNDVFMNVWYKRNTLTFPIHAYLIQSVKNGCLNYIRLLQSNEKMLTEHKKQLLDMQEDFILNNPTPLQFVESREVEKEVREAITKLPEKCRNIFEQYIFSGKMPEEIAREHFITVSTVRVQIKNALDKLKVSLSHLISFLIVLFLTKF